MCFSRLNQELWSLVSENQCLVYFPNPLPSLKIELIFNGPSLSQQTPLHLSRVTIKFISDPLPVGGEALRSGFF